MNTIATIKIWDKRVGVILWDEVKNVGSFEFDRSFVALNLDISPVHIPVASAKNGRRVFSFPFLNFETFKGLPGFLADSLPDKFGNQM
ncbi:HipA N-terminal domain-containing protein, partial [Flavobacterium sp.]|uniref:HipA N-terminal domain-containing protein n=1 Tax=Flavobacterium sp. TaxID=239 RepID=UPI003750D1DE